MKEKTRNRLAKVGEVLSSGGFSLLTSKEQEPTVGESRSEFIEAVYPKLFGEEEMGDPSRDFEPSEITAILVAYEGKLAADGLLKVTIKK